MLWKCSKCSEDIDESFDACWQCGTGRDGAPPPKDFGTEPKIPYAVAGVGAVLRGLDFMDEFVSRFKCAKCGRGEASVKWVDAAGTGMAWLFVSGHRNLIAVSCKHCAYTELFDRDILASAPDLSAVLDDLFGR
jgi:uncharacterized protein